ncbi:MAG: response regulator transcription factor [Candidatus Gastranaerophilales bacterium]|nr:response regulator transcription factor [Candidatus Gastranaerophilales bacterium]
MSDTTKILIAEDHKLLRVGLKAILDDHEDLEVIGEAENGKDAVKQSMETHPDIVLMDIGLPEMDGIQAARKIKEFDNNIKIIILTSHQDPNDVNNAIEAGVNAYALKDIKTEYLIMVIKTVNEGAIWFDPNIAHLIKNKSVGSKFNSKKEFKENHANLTEREYEVLKLIVDGMSNMEIAKTLNISEHTAKAHVCNIIQKMLVDDRTQVAVKAIKENLI